MQVLILLGLIVLNGLFAMAEIALVTARKARLQKYLDEGDRAAAAALALGEHPTRFLSTIQIGITSIGVLNGVFGEAALAQPMAQWLQAHAGLSASSASTVGTAVAVVGITYLSIVIGELVPKRLGQSNPEAIARLVARPIQWLAQVTRPFVVLLSLSTQGVLRLLGCARRRSKRSPRKKSTRFWPRAPPPARLRRTSTAWCATCFGWTIGRFLRSWCRAQMWCAWTSTTVLKPIWR